jgi:trigger factor
MAVTVETLEKLERRITLTLPADAISGEVESRLKRLARTVKADGFRPGKVPMSVVSQRYGYSVHYEVMNDKVGKAFADATNEAKLRVAGQPRITEKESTDGQVVFDATFEVYPEVKLTDVSGVEVERVSTEVTDAAIDKTLDILRKQRRSFSDKAAGEAAADGDQVTIDFEGKIDGVPFDGGKAQNYAFVLGDGQMLEAFEKAVRGMKAGDSKTFPLQFPEDYQGRDVAGKEADFLVTVSKIESQTLPEVNDDFAVSLGIKEGGVAALRADIRKNLEREVKFRVLARNKAAVMDAVAKSAELDLPKALVEGEIDRLLAETKENLLKRGVKDVEKLPFDRSIFQQQAEQRVKLGLVVAELVRTNNLNAKPEQLQAHIEDMAQSYESPAEVVRWYLGNRERMAEVEGVVIENNVTDFVLAKAKVTDKALPFDELMGAN